MIDKDTNTREEIIKIALLQLHKAYKHDTYGPNTFDCAGLVWFIYNEICQINVFEEGIGKSTTTKIMSCKYGTLTVFNERDLHKDLKLIKSGDVLFFHRQALNDNNPNECNKYPGHCGIYLGENKFIHASRPKEKVIISDFNQNNYWREVLVGSKDFLSTNEINNYTYKLNKTLK